MLGSPPIAAFECRGPFSRRDHQNFSIAKLLAINFRVLEILFMTEEYFTGLCIKSFWRDISLEFDILLNNFCEPQRNILLKNAMFTIRLYNIVNASRTLLHDSMFRITQAVKI
ncbi:hypothetical protein M758_1G016300 [Ceratodon purpureus]|nr:hypothetical protein M758_1G016300 [Ceratodon purpureus]